MNPRHTALRSVAFAAGFIAISAASVRAQIVPGPQNFATPKEWSIAAEIRGFYDDNISTAPHIPPNISIAPSPGYRGSSPKSSYGLDVTPAAIFNHSAEDTTVNLFGMFDERINGNERATQYQDNLGAQFQGGLQHKFGEKYTLSVHDSLVYSTEPTAIDTGIVTDPFRHQQDGLHNTGQVDLTGNLWKKLDFRVGYENNLYVYPGLADSVVGYPFVFAESVYFPEPSRSALLNRMEQLAAAELLWKFTDQTTGILGYRFGATDYTSHEFIHYPFGPGLGAPYASPPGDVRNFKGNVSNSRNNVADYAYVGVNQSWSDKVSASIRVGAEYVDYYNDDDINGDRHPTSRLSPYADASVTVHPVAADDLKIGVKVVHNATDVAGVVGEQPVMDAFTKAVFIGNTYALPYHFKLGVKGSFQDSAYVAGGTITHGQGQEFGIAEVNISYGINKWLMADAGYVYNRLVSDIDYREYTRNFVFLGFQGSWGR